MQISLETHLTHITALAILRAVHLHVVGCGEASIQLIIIHGTNNGISDLLQNYSALTLKKEIRISTDFEIFSV